MSATSVSVLWGAPYRKPRAGPAAGRRRRPVGRREFRRGCRNSVMEWRCQVGRLGEEAGVGPELDFWVSWPLGWRLMTRGQMRGAGKRVERGEPRPGPVATRCRAGGAGPELGQGGPEREGLRGGPSAPPTGRRCRCSKVGAEGCLLPRGVPREAGAGVRVCVYMNVTCAYAYGLRMCACLYVQYTCVCAGVYMWYTVYACVRVRSVCMCVHTCMCMVYVYVYLCVCTSMRLRVLCACVCARVCAEERRGGEKQQRQLSHCPGLPHFRQQGRWPRPPPHPRELACLPSRAAVPSEFPRVRFLAFWGEGRCRMRLSLNDICLTRGK